MSSLLYHVPDELITIKIRAQEAFPVKSRTERTMVDMIDQFSTTAWNESSILNQTFFRTSGKAEVPKPFEASNRLSQTE